MCFCLNLKLISTIANPRIECVTELRIIFFCWAKILIQAFLHDSHIWFLRFLYILGCCGPWWWALPYHSTTGVPRAGIAAVALATAAHKLNLLCTWWKLFPHFCRMRKLLLLIIFPLNAVGSTFSQALLLFSYLDPIPKGFHIMRYRENQIFVCLFVHLFNQTPSYNFYSSSCSL